jgi:3-oxo-5-alpha-steroid 4-dehydrogenase 1
MSYETFNIICLVWCLMAVITFLMLQQVNAPYGRHVKKGWGPTLPNKSGWTLMEFPSFAIILYFLIVADQSPYATLLSLLWLLHYFNRSFIFPFRIRTKGKEMPVVIVVSAIVFNLVNAWLNGYFLSTFEKYTQDSFLQWNFFAGLSLFVFGFIVNQISDNSLINLRSPGETGYKIPKGFLFEYISCPNHFGELVQWFGFALMAWNYPAACFFVWTAANLVPRSKRHHQWYLENFEDYPKNRKAVVPGFF